MGRSLHAYVEFYSTNEKKWKIATPMYWSHYSNKPVFNTLDYSQIDPRYSLLQGEDYYDIWYSFETEEEMDKPIKSTCHPISLKMGDPMSQQLEEELCSLTVNGFLQEGFKVVYVGDLFASNDEPIVRLRKEILSYLSLSNVLIDPTEAELWTKYPFLVRLVYYTS